MAYLHGGDGAVDTRIMWFRRDLRLRDNLALQAAVEPSPEGVDLRVVPLFIVDPALVQRGRMSPARLQYLAQALADLDAQLRAHGGRLVVRNGSPENVLPQIIQEVRATQVHATADVTPYANARDDKVQRAMEDLDDCTVTFHPGLYIHEPMSVQTGAGDMYKVFTPFHASWKELPVGDIVEAPKDVAVHGSVASDELPTAADLIAAAGLADNGHNELDLADLPDGGESAARDRMEAWLSGGTADAHHVDDYDNLRDRLAAAGTSRLSADLHYGCLSAREIIARLDRRNPGQRTFATELAWRDFYAHVLARWPEVLVTAFNDNYRSLPWNGGGEEFAAWCDGRTGYPIVDAGMRQLRKIGWMHNRARMITASFLTKDLRIHWRLGEDHFLRHLVDGDLASNNGGWQWASGTGTDAQPYFRIFNPTSQGQKFDPDGVYVRTWVPELATVPDRYLHEPSKMPEDVQQRCGVVIGKDYPAPIVDHKQARALTLQWFSDHRG